MSRILTVTPNSALDLWTTTKRLKGGPKLRCSAPRLDPGGGGINVSRVLQRLGGDTLALFTAGGSTGDQIAAALDREGVASERVSIAEDSRQSVSVMEEESDDVFRFVMPGPHLGEHEEKALLERMAELAKESAMVVGSGSLPLGAGDLFWAEAAGRVRDAGSRFVLDSASRVKPALDAGIWLLRENKDEIDEIAGRNLEWPQQVADWAAERIEHGGCEVVVVSHGGDGALMVTRDSRVKVAPPKVRVNSAIGAGDSFVAGLCLALVQQQKPEDALRLAVATAAATLLTPGTELCRREDVERLLEECGASEAL